MVVRTGKGWARQFKSAALAAFQAGMIVQQRGTQLLSSAKEPRLLRRLVSYPALVREMHESVCACLARRDASTATTTPMLAEIVLTQWFELTSESATVNWPRKNLVLPLKLPGTLVEGARGPST